MSSNNGSAAASLPPPKISTLSSVGQLLPPLALFLPLLAGDGSVVATGLAVAAAAFAFSAVRLLAMLARRPPPGTRRLRAVLACAAAVAVFGLAWLEAAPVARYVNGLAGSLQLQCTNLGKCPARIQGWDDAPGGSDTRIGSRVRYRLAYRTDGRDFRLCWQVAFGRCRSAAGGAKVPLAKVQAWPWPQLGAGGNAP